MRGGLLFWRVVVVESYAAVDLLQQLVADELAYLLLAFDVGEVGFHRSFQLWPVSQHSGRLLSGGIP